MKKRTLAAILCTSLALGLLAGCGSSSSSSSSAPAAPSTPAQTAPAQTTEPAAPAYPVDVTFICPSDAGGAMDNNSRLLAPYIEKHLGKSVDVVNMGGSACWVGWKYLYDADRDGSYVSYANFPNMITGYLDPANIVGLDRDDFEFLALYTSDYNVIMVNKDETRFSNAEEFFAYAKDNSLTVADAGARTDDAVAVALMEQELGYKFEHVHFQNSAEAFAAIMGGHVDAMVGNVSEAIAKGDEVITVAILAEERDENLPDVQTAMEVGVNVTNSSSRGVIAAQGIDPEAKELFIAALKEAMEDPDQLAAAAKAGVTVTPLYGADFEKWAEEQEKNIGGIYELLD